MRSSADTWRPLGDPLKQTYNWRVTLGRSDDPEDRICGHFKYNTGDPAPAAAIEVLCYQILGKLELPAAKAEFLTWGGVSGHVSHAVPDPSARWDQMDAKFQGKFPFPIADHIPDCFADLEPFYAMAAVDVWLCNRDRNGGNFMASLPAAQEKLQLWYIDHGHCLLQPGHQAAKWAGAPPEAYWQAQTFHGTAQAYAFIRSYRQIAPYIRRVEELDNGWLNEAVDTIVAGAPEYLSTDQAALIKEMLAERRDRLDHMMRIWCGSSGRSLD